MLPGHIEGQAHGGGRTMQSTSRGSVRAVSRPRAAAQATVELAALFTLLLPIVIGIVDLGRAYFAYDVLVHAVNEGARYGSIDSSTTSIVSTVQTAAGTIPLASGDVTVTCYGGSTTTTRTCSTMVLGDTVEVGASLLFTPITPLISAILPGGTLTIGATTRRSFQ